MKTVNAIIMKKTFCLLTLAGLTAMNVYGQFNVTTTNNANTLVTNLVGTGITASNATLNGAPVTAQGTFTCTGGCNLGFSSGIILTSGSAVVATLPNTGTAQGAMFPVSLSDPHLQSLATAQVFDACVLQFDFWVASDRMRFNYIFGSDEYSDYVNTAFNDVFGFFLSGPGITPSPRNIAIVPGTPNTPVAINNVNNGGPVGHGIPPPGPCMNCAYFRDNTVPVTYTTAWDGLTTPLMAQAKVCPCETYHIKLAVSDVNDQIFDSGVLLEHQSFSSVGQAAIYANGVQVPNNHIIYLCPGQTVTLCVLDNMTCTNNLNYAWNGGISGTTQCITVTQANLAPNGNYACVITHTINNQCFVWTTTVKVVYVNPPANASISGATSICQGGSTTLTANPSGAGYTYQWSTGANTQSINVTSTGTYTVTVSNACGSVSASATVTVGNAQASISGVTAICNGTSTTLTANAGQSYQWSTGQNTQSITVNTAGTYTVTVTQAGGCTASASVNVTVNNSPSPTIAGNLNICPGVSTVLNAGAGYASYQWSNGGSISQFLNVSTPGTYTVTVTDANGCTGSASATVNQLPAPTPTITGNMAFCQGGNTTLNAGAGYSSYQWNTGNNNQTINVTTAGTYTVTVTNNFGCTGTASATVTVYTNPTPSISGNLSFCSGSNTTLTATPGFSNYQWSNGANTSSITVNNAATYTVTVTDANGCVGSASVTTTVNPLPSPVIAGNNTICQNQTTTFDAGAGYASYQWSNGSNSQTITTGTAGNYVVTVTDANGCTASASVTLTVNPLPTPAITGITAFCQGGNTILNAGAGYSSYQWNTGNNNQTINVTTAGTYTVTVTNNFGCTGTASATVTVYTNPTPSISGNLSFCSGSNTTLTATPGFSNYQWSNGANTSSITVNNAATYTVTVTDANGCVGSASVTTTVNPLPSPVIAGNNIICQNQTTTFDAGAGYASYQWSNGSNSQTITTGTAGNYVVTVTDANGCTASASVTLTVNPLPTPSISGNTVFCQGDQTVLDAGAGYLTYLWSNGSAGQTITTGTAGNYVVTVTDANGCTNTASVTVTVNPLPNPQITGNNSICDGTTTTLSAGNYVSYQWSNGSNSSTITVSTAGNYVVTVTDANGCVGTSPAFTVTVNPLPTAVISQNSVICAGESAPVNLVFTGTPPFNFTYTNGQQNFTGTSASHTTTLTLSPTATTTYTLVSVTDANCPGSVSGNAVITVNPLPVPVITGNNVICDGASTTFTTGTFVSYQWSNGANTQQITVQTAGPYTVTVTDQNGCTASATQQLIVNPTPVIAFTNDSSQTCNKPFINFFNYSTYPPGSVFLWDFGDGSQSSHVSPSHIYAAPGPYLVSLTITTPHGCTSTLEQNIVVEFLPFPVADFYTDRDEVSITNATIRMIDQSQHAISWFWDFGDGNYSTEQNPTHTFGDYGKFRIKQIVTNVSGCRDEAVREVYVTPFFVPNAFTPNGDGLNDYFFNAGYEMNLQAYRMAIWNRWGQKIFETDNPNSLWDGRVKDGNPAPEGVYVYQIKFVNQSGKDFNFEGRVTLLR
jgi:gliding motility-associated-like protein